MYLNEKSLGNTAKRKNCAYSSGNDSSCGGSKKLRDAHGKAINLSDIDVFFFGGFKNPFAVVLSQGWTLTRI